MKSKKQGVGCLQFYFLLHFTCTEQEQEQEPIAWNISEVMLLQRASDASGLDFAVGAHVISIMVACKFLPSSVAGSAGSFYYIGQSPFCMQPIVIQCDFLYETVVHSIAKLFATGIIIIDDDDDDVGTNRRRWLCCAEQLVQR